MVPTRLRRSLLALAAIWLSCAGAGAQENLDAGKPASKLFAEGCAACHRSPRGLSKGRFSFTLFLYLQKHYASNASSAWALTSYLESVDAGKRGSKRAAARTPPPAASKPAPSTWTPSSSLRPPASIPGR